MTKEELLAKCKCYKGEKRCPDDVFFWGWECEKMYVRDMMAGKLDDLKSAVDFFCNLGLDKVPELKDGTPIEIQALLFERFCYQSDNDPETLAGYFPKFYLREWPKTEELDSDIIALKLWKGEREPQSEMERKMKEEFDEMKRLGKVPDIFWFD